MHRTRFVAGITALFLTTGIVVTAQRGQSGAPKPQHSTSTPKSAPHTTSKATKPITASQPKVKTTTVKGMKAPKSSAPKVAASQKPATTKVAKPSKPVPAKLAKTEKVAKAEKIVKAAKIEKTVKVEKTTKTAKTTKSTASATTTSTASTGTSTTVTLTPVQEKLKKNTNLAAKLTSRLPAGTDPMTAAAGFRNLGQFVAAVNVSNNLGISFTQLKAKMVTDGMSLGQAIQAVRPLTASATVEAQRAEYDARGMIAESEQQVQVVATATTTVSTSKSKTKARKPVQ